MSDPFVFVVGAGRSGTTLLTVLLDSHPQLAVPGESGGFIFRFCLGRDSWNPHGDPVDDPALAQDAIAPAAEPYDRATLTELVGQLNHEHRFRRWELSQPQLIELAIASQVATRTDVIRCCYSLYAKAQGKTRYADKTPDHVVHMHTLTALFPEARFAHLIRDGRDVALALKDTSWGAKDPADAARYWQQRVTAGAEAGRELGPSRYIELRYESLIADPEPEVQRLCTFASLEYDPVMLDHAAAARRQLNMSPVADEDTSLLRPITSGLRDWRQQMPAADVAAFEAVAGDTLARFGY